MNKYIYILFLLISIVSCLDKSDNKNSIVYESFSRKGKTIDTTFIFCSITATDIDYSYRVGKWTFTSSLGHKVAEGKYRLANETIWGHGGCPYSYLKNTININDWKFWNENGNEILPTKRILNLIKPIQEKIENPFKKDYTYYEN
ncbi:MAG: hypothetical protein EVB11_11625 [Winogradskyella sp.]|nr:MAG: hypothetical protein EVB11_11625 [Winogradskyella sp.]